MAAIGITTMMLAACGGSTTTTTPTAPTAATPIAVGVTTAATDRTTSQLTAVASFADGTTQDVTMSSAWQSSDPAIATVSASGLVAGVNGGNVDVRATFRTVVGTLRLSMASGPGLRVAITGIVLEGSTRSVLRDARVVVSASPDAGASTVTGAGGLFTLPGLSTGSVTLTVTKDGYQTSTNPGIVLAGGTNVELWLFPIPPTNGGGATATARCEDGSWSWATTLPTCDKHDGVAYPVCPGPLCVGDLKAARTLHR